MALKDWKKIGEMKWRKNYPHSSSTHITKYVVILKGHDTVLKPQIPWIVNIGNAAFGQDKHFKTKQKALAYAKAYMRSHPNG